MPKSKIIPFRVAYCTSEDEGSPSSELLKPGPSCKGWASAQYCIYPQEIIFQLDDRPVLECIEILVHSRMIPQSIEISLGGDPKDSQDPDWERAIFMPIGEVNCNEKVPFDNGVVASQFQRIELTRGEKIRSHFVRFLLKQNHITKHNDFNQVSLRGVSFIGVPSPPKSGQASGRTSRRGSRADLSFVPRIEDLAFVSYSDPDVCELIHQLEERKYEAVGTESYENARLLKHAIGTLIKEGPALGAIGVRKRVCACDQDYEGAKDAKDELEDKREKLYKDIDAKRLLELAPFTSKIPQSPPSGQLPPPVRVKSRMRERSPSPPETPPTRALATSSRGRKKNHDDEER